MANRKKRSADGISAAAAEFEKAGLRQKICRSKEFSAPYRIDHGKGFRLKDFDPADTAGLRAEDKPRAK